MGIVGGGRGCYDGLGSEEVMEGVFENGFWVGGCNGDKRNVKGVGMLVWEFVEGFEGVGKEE